MNLQIYLVVGQCVYLCNIITFSNAKALAGQNVRRTEENEFKFIVSIGILYNNNNDTCYWHSCTGSLVSNRDVLTAAHCLEHMEENEPIKIMVGSTDIRKGKQFSPAYWLTYAGWAKCNNVKLLFEYNDVVMIRLTKNVSNTIEPGVVSNIPSLELVDCNVTLAGWGRREDDSRPVVMQTADVRVFDTTYCKYKIKKLSGIEYHIQLSVFCTVITPFVLTNSGDSGGPVLYMNKIIGINISTCPFKDINIHPDKVNIHHGLSYYRDFVHDFILHH